MEGQGLIQRLKIRADIRRQIPTRKSVQEGKPDRLADLLEEAAWALLLKDDEISKYKTINGSLWLALVLLAILFLFK